MEKETAAGISSWRDVAKTAQELRDASISRVQPSVPDVPSGLPKDVTDIPNALLSTDEAFITQTSPEDLVLSLASGKLSCGTVVNAFLRRAGLAQKLVYTIETPSYPAHWLIF